MIVNVTTFNLLLRKNGMTQAALARRARLGTKTIGRVRRGEELRISNAEKIASVFNVSVEELQVPPSDELKQKADKKSGLSRLVADLNSDVRNALTLTSVRYKTSERDILEAAPYFFTLLAELSLTRRREKLETWKDAALNAIEQGPRRSDPMIKAITDDVWELYLEELGSIKQRDLSSGFTGLHPAAPTSKNPGNPFFSMLEELAGESGYHLTYEDVESGSFVPLWSDAHYDTITEFLDPNGELDINSLQAMPIYCGDVPLSDMPTELIDSGSGSERCSWVSSQPGYRSPFEHPHNKDQDNSNR